MNSFLKLGIILAIFWGAFWSLNGLDKFFNGNMEPMIENGLEKAVLVDDQGEVVYRQYAYEINGLFGSNRNAKTKTFFERIGISEDVSLKLLYVVAVFEIFLSVLFFTAAALYAAKKSIFQDTLAVAYKLSMLLFVVFCVVDILIGERIELWEHSTFMLSLLFSYFYLQISTASFSSEKLIGE